MKGFIEKLIGRLEELPTKAITRYKGGAFGDYEGTDYFIDKYKTKDIINELAEEYNNGWIPCSERLPEEATSYQVTEEVVVNSKKLYVVDIRLFGTEGEWLCPSNRKIIAWQSLPTPYKEGE